jgi:hypothetical protein
MEGFNTEEIDFNPKELENHLIENWGDNHIEAAIRIASTSIILPQDEDLMYQAVCIALTVYSNRLRDGKLNPDRRLH